MSSVLSIGNQEECHVLICLKDPKTTRHSGFSRWKKEMYRRVCQAAKRPESIFWCRVGGTVCVNFIFKKRNEHSLQWDESGFRSFPRCPVPFFDAGQRSRKTGMTVLTVVYNETRNTLIRAYFMCFFLTEILRFGCAEGATSSGRSPGRSVVPYRSFSIKNNKKFFSINKIHFTSYWNTTSYLQKITCENCRDYLSFFCLSQ